MLNIEGVYGGVTDAEHPERIEALFKKTRGGEGQSIKWRYVSMTTSGPK